MTAASHPSSPARYALQVHFGGADESRAMCGRVEHVLSGRRREFASGAELLELLQTLRAEQAAGRSVQQSAASL